MHVGQKHNFQCTVEQKTLEETEGGPNEENRRIILEIISFKSIMWRRLHQ